MDINNNFEGLDLVHFLPWVGKNYELGIKSVGENGVIYGTDKDPGKRILVLGESHYCADKEDAVKDLTIKVIDDFVYSESEHEPYKSTYIKFERSLAGHVINKKERKELWSHLMFYNYVQVPMIGPRISPTGLDIIDSRAPFFEVITKYEPDIIIVWGKRLFNSLPNNLFQYRGFENESFKHTDGYVVTTWSYKIDEDKTVLLLPIYHPSTGFSWDYWFEIISHFVNM